MDFEFSKNLYGQSIAKFSMDHEVIGRFFSDELINQKRIEKVLNLINDIESGQLSFKQYISNDYQLNFNPRGVEITLSSLDDDYTQDLPEDYDFYDQESQAECGLDDFKLALVAWSEFIS